MDDIKLSTVKIFSDGSDLEGIEKVENILYLRILKKIMWVIDGWPKEPNKRQIFRYYICILDMLSLVPGSLYLVIYTGKIPSVELGHSYITVFMNAIAALRTVLVLTKEYNAIVLYFLKEVHLFNFRRKSDYAYETHILVHKISHFFTMYVFMLMCCGILLFNLTPIYNSYAAGMFRDERPANASFDYAVFFALPFDTATNFKGYVVVSLYNWYISITCSTYFCIIDLTIFIMVFHLWGHMRVLSYNLENFPKPASVLAAADDGSAYTLCENKYNEEEQVEVFIRLRDCIQIHSLVINFSSMMADSFGWTLLVYLFFHQVSGCLLLLECSQLDTAALMRYGPLTIIIFQQLIQLSIIFELLGSSNDRLVDSVYSVPWEYMNTANRKNVFVMLRQTHRSMNLKACSMVTVGVQTMITILKTSFSYFVMLRTVADEEE
ncbi:uncharacterized protein LOC118264496 [Spodoptera frugiperda]|uniref:Odorant receptor n=1 Tax=Spodoptera frugiperda TaxID=7108 RepID=A0A9R0CXR4_SPOFR|nr:uncharacterized protein LOC118264496 [Spodoptera frugiperda]WCF43320.1 odorant receptor OR13 [Spodoptera frugiperda]